MGRLEQLREEMKKHNIDAYIILSDDFHGSEYVGDYFKCREYISGFDGSAGSLIIMKDQAGLWTDGRYFVQAKQQLEGSGITLYKMGEENVPTMSKFLQKNLKDMGSVGYDGRTVSVKFEKNLKTALKEKNIRFENDIDLVDAIWKERPNRLANPVWILEDTYTGASRGEKLSKIRDKMKGYEANCHLISSLDDIAWIYNIRGGDVDYNPVVLSYSLIFKDCAYLYVDENAIKEVKPILEQDQIVIKPYLQIYEDLKNLSSEDVLLLNENAVNVALLSCVPDTVKIVNQENPSTYMKAVKNKIEMKHIRKAHRKDGVAVTKLLYWLKQQQKANGFLDGTITELSVSEKLLEFRKEQDGFIEQSFAPIIAAGEHGAIVHYEATEQTNIPVKNNTFLLMDTGGQYYEGTTDITRTVVIGEVSEEQKRHYTAVLRGNLNLANAVFLKGVAGANLDYLARSPLWELGLDYNHGTGHGVGYLLNVHEGPNAIRLRDADKRIGAAFEEGMLTSDEPGLYIEGQYGIRLENLILCVNGEKTDYGQFLHFDTLTMVPFDRDGILVEAMSDKELAYLNQYHSLVYENIHSYLTKEEQEWLFEVTREIKR